MFKVKATTQNGNPINGEVRHKLTKNGKLFIDFDHRPKIIKKMNIEVEVEIPGNKFNLDLKIQDVEASFPCREIESRIVD